MLETGQRRRSTENPGPMNGPEDNPADEETPLGECIEEIKRLKALCDAFEAKLELERDYPHWDYKQRGMLKYALKWFKRLRENPEAYK